MGATCGASKNCLPFRKTDYHFDILWLYLDQDYSTAQSRRCFSVRKSWYYTMLFLALFVYFFVCLFFFFFAIAYISRSFVLSNQIEFAVLLNKSLVTFNTVYTLYVIRNMCMLYVIQSIHRLYVIRFICKSYVIRSMHIICCIRFVHKLSVNWSII
jgi:hypothetical protein